jgi:hypothetical protein
MMVDPFSAVMEAVLHDFPNNLRHITGELQLAEGEFENYASILQLPNAENCVITRFHSSRDTTASWQAKMFSSEEYGKAVRAYQDLFKKLQACYLRMPDGRMIFLQGKWEPAREEMRFTTSTLRLDTGDWRYQEMKVELELVYELSDWVVHINVISKKPDDEVGS